MEESQKDGDDDDDTTVCPCLIRQCAQDHHLWFPAIQACHDHEAWDMLQAASAATPPHTYVPWIILDGQNLDDMDKAEQQKDFLTVVCDAYEKKGGSYPACSSPQATQLEQPQQDKTPLPICWKDEFAETIL